MLVGFGVTFIPWIFVQIEYDIVKGMCNHRVDAYVVDQKHNDMHGKCDLTLEWYDAKKKQFREKVVVWDCDPTFSRTSDPSKFPANTCFKEGNPEELRILDVDRYDYYDRHHHIHHHHYHGDKDKIISATHVRDMKRTSVALFVIWVTLLSSFAICFLTLPCVSSILEKWKRKKTPTVSPSVVGMGSINPSPPLTAGFDASVSDYSRGREDMTTTMLPSNFQKSDVRCEEHHAMTIN
jgi:hypothetical protein